MLLLRQRRYRHNGEHQECGGKDQAAARGCRAALIAYPVVRATRLRPIGIFAARCARQGFNPPPPLLWLFGSSLT